MRVLGVVITKNEELHILRCIQTLARYVDDILVVDAFSDDQTVNISEKFGATVIQRKWKSYPDQLNWLLMHHTKGYDFVFRLDADEYINNQTPNKFRNTLSNLLIERKNVISVKRSYKFLGSVLKDSQIYKKNVVRIFTPNHRFENRLMDEKLIFDNLEYSAINLEIIDDNLKGVSSWLLKHVVYSGLEVENYMLKGPMSRSQNIYYTLPVFTRTALYFALRLVVTQRFRGGIPAIIYTAGQALLYRLMIDYHISETLNPSKLGVRACDNSTLDCIIIRAVNVCNGLCENILIKNKVKNNTKYLKLNDTFVKLYYYLPVKLRFFINLVFITISVLFSFFKIKKYKKFILSNSIFLLTIDMFILERDMIKNKVIIN